jgi:hypothetical protein
MTGPNRPWEPDPGKLGNNWQSMFDTRRTSAAPPPDQTNAPAAEVFDDGEIPTIDATEYRPWILQRGSSRTAMMLALRWFDTKAGVWHGSAIAYPSLYAIDHISDGLISLDFGARQFVIEGRGLDVLARYLLQGAVLKIVEYASAIWPTRADGPVVTAIRRVTPGP